MSQGKVSEITIEGDALTGIFKEPVNQSPGASEKIRYRPFETVLPFFEDPELIGLHNNNEMTIKGKSEKNFKYRGSRV